MRRDPVIFNVRQYVRNSGYDNEIIQATYNAINRMAFLIGDLTISTYLAGPWSTVLDPCPTWIKDHGDPVLFRRPEAASASIALLLKHPTLSFLELARNPRARGTEIMEALFALHHEHAIFFPHGGAVKTMQEVVDHGSNLKYTDIFTKTPDEVGDAFNPLQAAIHEDILFRGANHRCCDRNNTSVFFCRSTLLNLWCSCPTPGDTCGSACSAGSDSCVK